MKHKPFFGILGRALIFEASESTPAFRLTPHDRVRYSHDLVAQITFRGLCARIAHLSLHAALGAFVRRGKRDAKRWNVAHDLAIQPLLEAAGLGVMAHTGAPIPEELKGAAAEEFYEHLEGDTTPGPLWADLCDVPAEDSPASPTDASSEGSGEGDNGEGEDSSAEGGADNNAEGGADIDGDPDGIDAQERALQWKMRLAAAYEEERKSGHKTFGDEAGWADAFLSATLQPPADWSVVLQESLTALHRVQRTYLRPSRRFSALAEHAKDGSWPAVVTMPGRRVRSAGQLVVVIDTSASIRDAELASFLGVVAMTATAEGIDEVRLVQADAEVTRDEVITSASLLFETIRIVGRGGTDFGPALRLLERDAELRHERFTVVYLTDLDGQFPSARELKRLDVLWVVPNARRPVATRPPFGRTTHLRRP